MMKKIILAAIAAVMALLGVNSCAKVQDIGEDDDTIDVTGIPAVEFTLVPDWSVTPVDGTYNHGYVDVAVNAPGIQWYYAEEATDQYVACITILSNISPCSTRQ